MKQSANGTNTTSTAGDSVQLFSICTFWPIWSGCAVAVLLFHFSASLKQSVFSPYVVTLNYTCSSLLEG